MAGRRGVAARRRRAGVRRGCCAAAVCAAAWAATAVVETRVPKSATVALRRKSAKTKRRGSIRRDGAGLVARQLFICSRIIDAALRTVQPRSLATARQERKEPRLKSTNGNCDFEGLRCSTVAPMLTTIIYVRA